MTPRLSHPPALRLGLVGCGAIGSVLANALAAQRVPGMRLLALADQVPGRAEALAAKLRPRPRTGPVKQWIEDCDLLLEAAGVAAVPPLARLALRAHKDLVVLSVGALIGPVDWRARFRRAGLGLHFPSGALAGLDALKAAAAGGGLRSVQLITRKPPQALAGAPGFKASEGKLKRAQVIFTGSATEAVKAFPANINVAAAAALAGIGPRRTRVTLIADPGVERNTHRLIAEGPFGRFFATTENVPSRENPKTSRLAALSALVLLQGLADRCRSGS